MLKKFCALLLLGLVAPIDALATPEDEMVKLMNYIEAHASCSSYISSMYSDYKGAGFSSDKEAEFASDEHRRLASYAAGKVVDLFMTTEIDGEKGIVRKGNQFCMGSVCFEKLEYIEAMFFLGPTISAGEEINTKPLSCPSGEWAPCTAREPVDRRYYKARDLYETKNCALLLP